MAYTPREIKDRVAVGDDIFIVEDLGDNRVRLIPAPTHVLEVGTPVNKALLQPMENHMGDVANPHATTKAQVGLGNVDNVKQASKSEFDAHANLTAAHSATSTATANRIIIRDSAGRAKVAAPSASDDIARKAEVDAVSSALNTHRSSGDHDGRYYIKSQLDPFLHNLLLTHWTEFHSGTSEHLRGVAYANGLWVAVGDSGTILTSTNGTSWTKRTSGTSEDL